MLKVHSQYESIENTRLIYEAVRTTAVGYTCDGFDQIENIILIRSHKQFHRRDFCQNDLVMFFIGKTYDEQLLLFSMYAENCMANFAYTYTCYL